MIYCSGTIICTWLKNEDKILVITKMQEMKYRFHSLNELFQLSKHAQQIKAM